MGPIWAQEEDWAQHGITVYPLQLKKKKWRQVHHPLLLSASWELTPEWLGVTAPEIDLGLKLQRADDSMADSNSSAWGRVRPCSDSPPSPGTGWAALLLYFNVTKDRVSAPYKRLPQWMCRAKFSWGLREGDVPLEQMDCSYCLGTTLPGIDYLSPGFPPFFLFSGQLRIRAATNI